MSNQLSLIISVVGSLTLLLTRGFLEASKEGRLLAGVLGGILYIFVLSFVGNMRGRGVQVGIFEVIVSLFIILGVMSAIHPASVTLCLLLSGIVTFETAKVAQERFVQQGKSKN